MTTQINMLAFARDLADLQADLTQAAIARGYDQLPSAKASAFSALLIALTDGQEPVPAIAEAIRVWKEVGQAKAATRAQREADARARYEWTMIEEKVTREVECPYCGAVSGDSCRTVSDLKTVRTNSHRDRFRAARSIAEGTQP